MSTRLFTFGCSFTKYIWPTWANILGLEFDSHENWGQVGGGNHFIFYSLVEAIERGKICSDDTVMIMWTSVGREDRFINNNWQLHGSVYNSSLSNDYIKNYTDPTGFLLTSATVIHATKRLLDQIRCKYRFFSTVPFTLVDDSFPSKLLPFNNNTETQIYKLYKKSLDLIEPSVFELVFNKDWHSRNHVLIPSAKEHALRQLKNQYEANAGVDWPSFNDFAKNETSTVANSILNEIHTQFQFDSWRDLINTQRQDNHCTPSEHAEYLEKIGFNLTLKQQEYINYWNRIVLTANNVKFEQSKIHRF